MTVTIEFEDRVGDFYMEMRFRVSVYRKRWWLFGARVLKYTEVYRGEGTVWHRVPDGARAGTWLEVLLSNSWTAKCWELDGD